MNINISEILSMNYISMKNYKHNSAIHHRAFQLMNIVIVFVTKIIKVLLLKEISYDEVVNIIEKLKFFLSSPAPSIRKKLSVFVFN